MEYILQDVRADLLIVRSDLVAYLSERTTLFCKTDVIVTCLLTGAPIGIVEGGMMLGCIPRIFTFLKGSIIQLATTSKYPFKLCTLFFCGIDTIFERLHYNSFLVVLCKHYTTKETLLQQARAKARETCLSARVQTTAACGGLDSVNGALLQKPYFCVLRYWISIVNV